VTPLTAAFYVSAGPYNYYPPFYIYSEQTDVVEAADAANAAATDAVCIYKDNERKILNVK
jgi:hypothetical protein